jgi:hypothetical protein
MGGTAFPVDQRLHVIHDLTVRCGGLRVSKCLMHLCAEPRVVSRRIAREARREAALADHPRQENSDGIRYGEADCGELGRRVGFQSIVHPDVQHRSSGHWASAGRSDPSLK